jgi:hypothetical protein
MNGMRKWATQTTSRVAERETVGDNIESLHGCEEFVKSCDSLADFCGGGKSKKHEYLFS